MSACMSGTRGSGVLSSTGDVLVRGVGGVFDMCMCLARGGLSCLEWSDLDWSRHHRFCEQQRQPSSGSACPKNGKSVPH